jgi:phage-related protein
VATKKPIIFVGSAKRDLLGLPESVRKDFGGALHGVQEGRTPEGAKSLKGKAKGATQLSEDHDGNTFRAVYTVELDGEVYVLHCFQKKSKSGIATPPADLATIVERLKAAREIHAHRKGAKS